MVDKSEKGLILSFIATLPMQDAHREMGHYTRCGLMSTWANNEFQEFLAKRQEKTPQGGPAGSTT